MHQTGYKTIAKQRHRLKHTLTKARFSRRRDRSGSIYSIMLNMLKVFYVVHYIEPVLYNMFDVVLYIEALLYYSGALLTIYGTSTINGTGTIHGTTSGQVVVTKRNLITFSKVNGFV